MTPGLLHYAEYPVILNLILDHFNFPQRFDTIDTKMCVEVIVKKLLKKIYTHTFKRRTKKA